MRVFVAATFPESVILDLSRGVDALKPKLPAASWVRPESQHVTLAFLGEQPQDVITDVAARLTRAVAETSSFEARLSGCGFFPNRRRARVGWIGLTPHEPFAALAAAVRREVMAAGIELDRIEFKPHLTLMRIRDSWPPASCDVFERALGSYESAPFVVDKITLYSSELSPKGAKHTPLRQFVLL